MGLLGAVLATAAANGVALFLMLALCRRYGLGIQRGTIVGLLLPLSIPAGPWVVILVLAAVLVETLATDRYLLREEKQEIVAGARQYLAKFGFGLRGTETCRVVSSAAQTHQAT